jgi:NAD kinase
LGRLGFLAGAAPEEFEKSIQRLKNGEYEIEERMGLEAHLDGKTVFALNEFVIEKGVLARMVQVKTWISDTPISSFFGNGLIVATPTGSTSYSGRANSPSKYGGLHRHSDMSTFTYFASCCGSWKSVNYRAGCRRAYRHYGNSRWPNAVSSAAGQQADNT